MDDLKERLRDHPECITITLLDQERPFLLTMWGLEVAREQGYDLVPRILDLGNRLAQLFGKEELQDQEMTSAPVVNEIQNLLKDADAQTLSIIVWWGLVTFDEDLTLKEVQMMLTPGTVIGLVPKVLDRVNAFADDQLEEDTHAGSEEAGEGKSPEPASSEPSSEADTDPGSTDD